VGAEDVLDADGHAGEGAEGFAAGAFVVDGLIVEVLGGVQKRIDGVWEAPVDVDVHRRWVPLEGLTVPVLSLAYEEQAYRALGRIERADLLRDWLQGRPQTPGS